VELSAKQRQYLRALAHSQKPVVQIGTKGVGETVFQQIRDQLLAHELVKIRFNTESAVEPEEVAAEIVLQTKSQLVQQSGRVLVLYRRNAQKPTIALPKAARPGPSPPALKAR
jgi:RNA-binding protein